MLKKVFIGLINKKKKKNGYTPDWFLLDVLHYNVVYAMYIF